MLPSFLEDPAVARAGAVKPRLARMFHTAAVMSPYGLDGRSEA
jgi:hypothetical protein